MRGFSFSNFDAERRRKLAKDIKSMAFVKMGIAVALFLMNPFLGVWVGSAGLMLGGLAGGMRFVPAFGGKTNKCSRNTGLRLKTFRQVRVCNYSRARRSASRPAFTSASGGDSSDGGSESDSGDPPGPSFPFLVKPFQYFYRKPNSFISPWHVLRGFGCWHLSCNNSFLRGVLA